MCRSRFGAQQLALSAPLLAFTLHEQASRAEFHARAKKEIRILRSFDP